MINSFFLCIKIKYGVWTNWLSRLLWEQDIIRVRVSVPRQKEYYGIWYNGITSGFGPDNRGSNPLILTKE